MTVSDDKTPIPPAPGRDADKGFGARWSRRKLAARRNETDHPPRGPDPAAEGREPAPSAGPEAPALTDADMPPIASLDEESDYAPFLSSEVSGGLRRKALRKLFGLPGFQVSDGLNDYDEDYRRFTPLGDLMTHEMRRMLETRMEPADRAADREEEETPPEVTGTPSTEDVAAPDTGDAQT